MIKSLVQQQFGAHAAAYATSAVHAKGASLERCLYTGAIAAGEVIQHFGARPMGDLKALVAL